MQVVGCCYFYILIILRGIIMKISRSILFHFYTHLDGVGGSGGNTSL